MKYIQLLPLLFILIFSAACTPNGSEPSPELASTTTTSPLDSYPVEEQTMPETTPDPYPATTNETIPTDPYPANDAFPAPQTDSANPAQIDLSQITPQPVEDTIPHEAPQPGVPNPQANITHEVSQDLAKRLDADVSQINIISVEEVDWSDSSLGCPAPGMGYLMVITPGYIITLEQDGKSYTYHTNVKGNYVLCGQDGQPIP